MNQQNLQRQMNLEEFFYRDHIGRLNSPENGGGYLPIKYGRDILWFRDGDEVNYFSMHPYVRDPKTNEPVKGYSFNDFVEMLVLRYGKCFEFISANKVLNPKFYNNAYNKQVKRLKGYIREQLYLLGISDYNTLKCFEVLKILNQSALTSRQVGNSKEALGLERVQMLIHCEIDKDIS